jgi:hypothetical protein
VHAQQLVRVIGLGVWQLVGFQVLRLALDKATEKIGHSICLISVLILDVSRKICFSVQTLTTVFFYIRGKFVFSTV